MVTTVEPLPLPDDARLPALIDSWPAFQWEHVWPRSAWLRAFELILGEHYPNAPRRRLNLTARLAAPFPLALPGVP